MQSEKHGFLLRSGLTALMALTLTACSGSGALTPPGTIGTGPQSIVESQPPVDNYTDQQPDNLPTDGNGTDGLPPANQVASNQQPNQYQPPATAKAFLTFEPMVGAPKSVARELSGALGMRVAQHSLPVVARTDKKATHRVKGYFTANQSGSDCVVSYVWDIFDANGKRITRVTGSQKTTMVSTDPWDSVKGDVLDKVAVDTAGKLKSWHTSI